MPAVRTLSRRNVRGAGWHKRGYRENGDLYIQLKRSYAGFSRMHYINENESISAFIRGLFRDVTGEDPFLDEDLHYEFYARRQLLVPSDEMVKSILDGGETVYAKAFDDNGIEYNWDGMDWEAKPARGRRAT